MQYGDGKWSVAGAGTEKTPEAARRSARTRIAIGAVLLIGGGLVTLITYIRASGGGTYHVLWGAMAIGLINLVRGLAEYLGNREPADAKPVTSQGATPATKGALYAQPIWQVQGRCEMCGQELGTIAKWRGLKRCRDHR
jgi:hypothetical protein